MPAKGRIALRTALQAVVRLGASDADLRRAVALFAAEARRRGLLAEQVLVLLKGEWGSLPEVRALRRSHRDPRLDRLISETIRAYYVTPAAAAPTAPADAGRPEAR